MKNFKTFVFLSALLCLTLACGAAPTLTRSFAQGYPYLTGGTLDVCLDFDANGTAMNALYFMETLPAGWTFDSLVSEDSGGGVLVGTSTTKFECLWLEPPTNETFQLIYRVNVPAGQSGTKTFAGEMDWALFQNTPQTVLTGGRTSIVSDTQVITPVIMPPDGTPFAESLEVTIVCDEVGSVIYYTLDGSTPTTNSTLYTAPFDIAQTCVVIARAFKPGKIQSELASATYYQELVYNDSALTVGVRANLGDNGKLADIGKAMGGTPSLVKISKTSLPAGLKIALVKDSLGNYSVMLTGAPTSVPKTLPLSVAYEVRTKVVQGGKTVTITLTTIELNFAAVQPLPAPVVGTFNGWIEEIPGIGIGTVTMTLSAKGAASGKIKLNGVNYTFKATAFDSRVGNIFTVKADVKAGSKAWDKIELLVDASTGAIEGPLVTRSGADVYLFRNNWNNAAWFTTQFAGYYTAQIPNGILMPDETAPQGTGYMTLNLSGKGAARWSGKLADGRSYSGSGVLLHDTVLDRFYLPVVASYNSKKACFAAILEIKPGGATAALNTITSLEGLWYNTDFKSVYSEDLDLRLSPLFTGFNNTVRVAGGFYNKTGDFAAHYLGQTLTLANTPAGPLAYTYTAADNTRTIQYEDPACDGPLIPLTLAANTAAGLSFSVKGDLKKIDGEWNYDTALNPLGLTFKFTKATGLFSGKFNVYYDYLAKEGATTPTHIKKSVSYKGVLTPWRDANPLDDALPEGAGYYLLSLGDKCSYIDDKGKPQTYTFGKWSYGFWIDAD